MGRRRRVLLIGAVVLGVGALAIGGSVIWAYAASSGHRHDVADAPDAPVVIVLGAKVRDDRPLPFLTGRLDATIELVRAGKARSVLVSGAADGDSGDETTAMTEYLVARGVDPEIIAVDRYGLDTYDTCIRAKQVYGVDRALLVTQPYHLPRAVALCRSLGIDAEGVAATCDCDAFSMAKNRAREWLATVDAVREATWHREPAVVSTPDDSLRGKGGWHDGRDREGE